VFKTKGNIQGEVEKYKARLVTKGYKQQYEVNYKEVIVVLARLEIMRWLILLTT
jgi:hypothetical protein